MLILLTALTALSSSVHGFVREIFPVHDDGQDISNHFLKGRLSDLEPKISPRIGLGENGIPGELPFVIQIRYEKKYRCAGALVHGYHQNQIVLTTAECVTNPHPNNGFLDFNKVQIIGGKFHKDGEYFYEQVTLPSKIIRHEKWDRHNIINDLAIIFLKKEFELNAMVHTIELPHNVKDSYPPSGKILTVGGWGYVSVGAFSPILQTVHLPVQSYGECYSWYLFHDNARHLNSDSTLCGRDDDTDGRKNVCQGDWGAPARAYDNGTEYLAGIFSWAEDNCAENKFPSLFQKMTYFRPWVIDTSFKDPAWGK